MHLDRKRFLTGHRHGLGGFTLAEALLASTALAITTSAVCLPLLAATENAQQAEQMKYATELGQSAMEEILARPLVDPRVADTTVGPSAAEPTRKAYVNVDAFSGLSESSQTPADYTGTTISAASVQGFWRSVTVQYVQFTGQPVTDTTGFARVTVNVYYQSTLLVTFTRLVAAEG